MGELTRESADTDSSGSRGLLVITGASHTGKTSVARAILELRPPPVALLGVDQVLDHTLLRPHGERWKEIPLAYRLLRLQAEALLQEDWFVVLESTFTYVPEEGRPEFHSEEIEQLIGVALASHAPFLIVRLEASETTILQRAENTERLPLAVVAETLSLHRSAEMPPETLLLDSDRDNLGQLAQVALVRFSD